LELVEGKKGSFTATPDNPETESGKIQFLQTAYFFKGNRLQ